MRSAAAAVLLLASAAAFGQAFPSRPVRIVVPFPPGGGADTLTRIMEPRLVSIWSQPVIVENRPGASGSIGADFVARSVPDGATLLMSSTASLTEKNVHQFAPVSLVSASPYIVTANPKVAASNIRELIALAKSQPGKLSFGSSGTGAASHLSAELFKSMAGVDLVAVHYRGSFFPDLLGGQVQISFSPIPSSLDFIRAGKLRALAVTTATRAELLPDIPTIGEFVPGYEATAWFGIGAPKKTPAEIVGRLNKEINSGLADPTFKARLLALGVEPKAMASDEFSKFVVDETDKWGNVIRGANIKAE